MGESTGGPTRESARTARDELGLGWASEEPLAAAEGLAQLDALAICRLMNAEDARVAAAVGTATESVARAIEALAERFVRGGRLLYAGAGTSGRLGVLDASECPPTFGVAPERVVGLVAGGPSALVRAVEGAEDDAAAGARDLLALQLTAHDAVCAISASGRTPYALGALAAARDVGALALAVTCNEGTALAAAADLAIEIVTGPEVLAGSTRLKAGTATKLVLNMLTTGLFVRLGYTLGHRMKHLRATNGKLTERAVCILAESGGLDPDEARARLARAGGDLAAALAQLVDA